VSVNQLMWPLVTANAVIVATVGVISQYCQPEISPTIILLFSPSQSITGEWNQGVIKPLFCVLEDELLSASDELLTETGQPHRVVRSHNELDVAKVASCVSKEGGSVR